LTYKRTKTLHQRFKKDDYSVEDDESPNADILILPLFQWEDNVVRLNK